MRILIKNGRLIDPLNNVDEKMDILISNGIVEKIEQNITESVDKTIDANNMWVTPGFIDLHVHLREPGYEHKETIATGTRSAVMGGFTSICCMPNTKPVTDNEILVEYIKMKAEREGVCRVLPVGAITVGQKGEALSDIGKMAKAGACAISEDGFTVENASLMKTAIKYAQMFDIPVFSHCEDVTLAGGSMNAGDTATKLGLKGISNESEDVIVSRDIILADSLKAPIHLCHISTKGAVDLIKDAKARGSKVTAEATPHHFTLVDEDITDYDGNYKMNPPLRSTQDRAAIIEALKNDTIQVIATDHAPHHIDEKNCEFERALNGIVGLETALSLSISELVEKGVLTPFKMIEKLTKNPAKVLRRKDLGHLSIGAKADIAIIDPNVKYKINIENFVSKGKNSPFNNREVTGKVLYTLVDGKIIVENGQLREEYK
ncbi:dihydroorotase [uncultured Tyzzerella sp.]|uniref:dihydroorotase n=1 Tax=uncultured Tyzzerella sp. TaxID=2321398 RepID=UPI002942EB23|nr:dihydroorotase [uncultured Tyzzerella sp.]